MMYVRQVVLSTLAAAIALGQPQNLDADLRSYTESSKVPALVAIVCSQDAIVAVGAAGVRRVGDTGKVSVDDRFNIGSNAKAMLATVITMLVEEGKLNWDTKAADLLEIPRTTGLRTNEITLKQLLNHHAGLPPFEDDSASEWKAWTKERPLSGSGADRVQQFAQWLLQRPTIGAPGAKSVYSNAGYVVAAAMVERVMGMPWKDAVRKRLFEPLGMNAAFGWPAADNPNEPFGHLEKGKVWKTEDPHESIPPFIQPAGIVSVSAPEYVKFLQLHLRGLNGKPKLLSARAFTDIHTPVNGYGLGWKITEIGGAPASFHTGSTDSFFAIATLVPSRDLAIAVLINAGGERAQAVAVAATKQLLAKFQRNCTSNCAPGKRTRVQTVASAVVNSAAVKVNGKGPIIRDRRRSGYRFGEPSPAG